MLTDQQAYNAMFEFLNAYWIRGGKPDEIGDILSNMQFLPDGSTADPAYWDDWLKAIDKGADTDHYIEFVNSNE